MTIIHSVTFFTKEGLTSTISFKANINSSNDMLEYLALRAIKKYIPEIKEVIKYKIK